MLSSVRAIFNSAFDSLYPHSHTILTPFKQLITTQTAPPKILQEKLAYLLDGQVCLYRIQEHSEQVVATIPKDYDICQASESLIACGKRSSSDSIILINLSSFRISKLETLGQTVKHLFLSERELIYITSTEDRDLLNVYNIIDGRQSSIALPRLDSGYYRAVFLNGDQWVFLYKTSKSSEIFILDTRNMEISHTIDLDRKIIDVVATSSETAPIATIDQFGQIDCWQLDGFTPVHSIHMGGGEHIAMESLSFDKIAVLTSHEHSANVSILKLSTQEIIEKYPLSLHNVTMAKLAIKKEKIITAMTSDPDVGGELFLYYCDF